MRTSQRYNCFIIKHFGLYCQVSADMLQWMGREDEALKKLWNFLFKTERGREIVRYLFIGGTTTALNFAITWLLKEKIGVDGNVASWIGIAVSVVYAYITNKWFVFRSRVAGKALLLEMGTFFGSRAATIALEAVGVPLLTSVVGFWPAKIGLNVVIIVANYIFSKLIIFKKPTQTKGDAS